MSNLQGHENNLVHCNGQMVRTVLRHFGNNFLSVRYSCTDWWTNSIKGFIHVCEVIAFSGIISELGPHHPVCVESASMLINWSLSCELGQCPGLVPSETNRSKL